MAKNPLNDDRRRAAREKARQIAQAQAKREKTAKIVLFSGIGAVVLAVIVVVVILLVQAARPAPGPNAYSQGGITLVKDGSGFKPVAAKGASGDDVPDGLAAYSDSGLSDKAAVVKVYMDFQCPSCKSFEEANGSTLKKLAGEGKIAVDYQPVAILDSQSQGNQYSTRAANLAACVADSGQGGKFFDFTKAMFDGQPEEQSNGLDDDAMLANAKKGGVDVHAKIAQDSSKTVADCAREQTFQKYVEKSTKDATSNGLQGTPRVEINGEDVDPSVWGDPTAFATKVLQASGEIQG